MSAENAKTQKGESAGIEAASEPRIQAVDEIESEAASETGMQAVDEIESESRAEAESEGYFHTPVLFDEVMEALRVRPDGIYVDGTVGGGGHARGVALRLSTQGRLIGIDRDQEAIDEATNALRGFGDRAILIKGNYLDAPEILAHYGIAHADGILLDLGVSSHQFDDAKRGFSYRNDAHVDMRMDKDEKHSAWDVINNYDEERLVKILRDYGEERRAKNIARMICRYREKKPIETTLELADIVKAAIPARARRTGGHPAKRTFQAIRIEVNGELDILENAIGPLINLLGDRGRMAVISFHSLEDRIVKEAFRKAQAESKGQMVNKKLIRPSGEEMIRNPRARSAKLRVFERALG